ncbi:hypothetical protein ITP53_38390 [Nonomuraea sp. K274]|uniref:Uncharacterized protein n=1 Tax=Nonomuraea cypriaca TaxID=1187855 RepID=A0A931F3B6_9ACTN|nr:hypothetical protein [Nonomuraea cypriaca]MBF8191467.1 hypothetical protein [Nonomuraea cypriaca]
MLGRHIDANSYDAGRVTEELAKIGLDDQLTAEKVREIVSGIVLPPFEVALRGLTEAAEYGKRHDLPVLVHNAAASMRQVARIAADDVRLIAGHSNHDSLTVEEAVRHAEALRELGATVDVSTLDCLGARRLVDGPELTFTMLREGLGDTISTDYAAGFHDPILLCVSEAVKAGAVELDQPAHAMLRRAAELVLADPPEERPVDVMVEPTLVVRESSG